MSLWSSLTKRLLDVVEWTARDDATLGSRFAIGDAIQMDPQLTARASQRALRGTKLS